MTTINASPKGEFLLPKEVLEAHGIPEGAEVEVSGGERQIVLRVIETDKPKPERSLTLEEFLARRRKYDGPPITDGMIRQAIDQAVIEDWARLERQWNDKKGD